MGCGGPCVTVDGTPEMPKWCASNLNTKTQVSEMFNTALSTNSNHQLTLMLLLIAQTYFSGSEYTLFSVY